MLRSTFEKKFRHALKVAQVPVGEGLRLAYAGLTRARQTRQTFRQSDMCWAAAQGDRTKYEKLILNMKVEPGRKDPEIEFSSRAPKA